MAKQENKSEKKQITESALHYGLKKKVKVYFIDNSAIEGTLDFVNRYEYVLKDASRKVRKKDQIVKDKFENEVVILKASVKYLTVIE